MSRDARALLIILILNTAVTVLYGLLVGAVWKKQKAGIYARCFVMLLCPIVGPAYFGLGWLLRRGFFHEPVDLTDVIFSKSREKALLKADEQAERNLVPVEDVLTVFDTDNARSLMLRVLRTDVRKSLGSIAAGLNSNDSEISHYAASMMQSELGKIRNGIKQISAEIDRIEGELAAGEDEDGDFKTQDGAAFSALLAEVSGTPKKKASPPGAEQKRDREKEERQGLFAKASDKPDVSEDYARRKTMAREQGLRAFYGDGEKELTTQQKLTLQAEAAHRLIEDISGILKQNVLSELESERYAELMNDAALLLKKRDTLSTAEMACVAQCHLQRGDTERCREWSDLLCALYPESLDAYETKLKLLYRTGEREAFFSTLEQMKKNGVPLDHEMMETVRFFL